MMTRDVMVGLVCEMYEVADKISKAEGLWMTMKMGVRSCPTKLRSY